MNRTEAGRESDVTSPRTRSLETEDGNGASSTRSAARSFGNPRAGVAARRFFSRKGHKNGDTIRWLRDVDVLRSVEDEPLERLASSAVVERYGEDETIYRSGSRSDALYVVRDGAVGMFTDYIGHRLEFLDRITSGQVFGEMGILESAPRAASACAMGGATVIKMDAGPVREILDTDSTFASRLTVRAISLHCVGPSSRLRADRRLPIGRDLLLRCGPGEPIAVRLVDLSMGGARFDGLPALPGLDAGVWEVLDSDRNPLLTAPVEVVWRQGATAGVRFTDRCPAQEGRIQGLIDRLAT